MIYDWELLKYQPLFIDNDEIGHSFEMMKQIYLVSL